MIYVETCKELGIVGDWDALFALHAYLRRIDEFAEGGQFPLRLTAEGETQLAIYRRRSAPEALARAVERGASLELPPPKLRRGKRTAVAMPRALNPPPPEAVAQQESDADAEEEAPPKKRRATKRRRTPSPPKVVLSDDDEIEDVDDDSSSDTNYSPPPLE